MVNAVFLYPGQGAQYPGMGQDLWHRYDLVKELFSDASEICGQDMKRLLFEADETELKQVVNTQTAITLVNASVREVLRREYGFSSSAAAGFSSGELSALFDAGCMDFEDLMMLVKRRAEEMVRCSSLLEDQHGGPAMAAVIGLNFSQVRRIVAEHGQGHVYAANDNSPLQVALSGLAEPIGALKEHLIAGGARRVIPLKVTGPFHTPLLQDAAAAFQESLESVNWKPFQKPCCANVSGGFHESAAAVPQLLTDQIVSPVRWVDNMEALRGLPLDQAVEAGPGKVLAGLWKGVSKEIPCHPGGTLEQIEALAAEAKLQV